MTRKMTRKNPEISDVPSLENHDSDFYVTRKTTRSPNESRTKNDTQNDNNHTNIQDTSNISSPPPTPSSGAGPEKTTAATKSPEDYWRGCGYRLTLPAREAFQGWREKGMEDELIITAIREAGVHEAKSPLAYIRPILDRAAAAGQLTLAAWQAAHPPGCSGGGKRVDRPEPSGNDFLADAVSRPRRPQETRLRGGQAMDITSEIGTPGRTGADGRRVRGAGRGDHLAAAAGPRLPERGPAAAGRKPHARHRGGMAGPPSGRKWRMCRSAWAGSTRRATPST